MNKQNGITIIALVITIIVLLILAGVSISLVVGENGVLTQASTSVVKTREVKAKEEVSVAWASMESDYLREWTQNTSLLKDKDYIKAKLDIYLESTGTIQYFTYDEINDTYKFTYKPDDDNLSYEITINAKGKAIVGEGIQARTESSFIRQITFNNYGDYVNYENNLGIKTAGKALSDGNVPQTDWRIFYKDANNVYLIASDFLPASKFPNGVFAYNNSQYNGCWAESGGNLTTNGTITSNNNFLFTKLSNVTKTNKNYKAVTTLLDTGKWSVFAKEDYVDNVETSVIGSPTVEMWMASWNEKYSDTLALNINEIGYAVGLNLSSLSTDISPTDIQAKEGYNDTLYFPHASKSTAWNNCYGYWLASPSAYHANYVICVDFDGSMYYGWYKNCYSGVRPVVALSSSVKATPKTNDDGTIIWTLSK